MKLAFRLSRSPLICILVSLSLACAARAELTFQPLGFAPDATIGSRPLISGDGTSVIIDYYASSIGRHVRWSEAGGFQSIGIAKNSSVSFNSVSADGFVAAGDQRVFVSEGSYYRTDAVVWTTNGGLQVLSGFPDWATKSSATSVSADGSTVVGGFEGELDGQARTGAFRWTAATGVEVISEDGYALDVSADGSTILYAIYGYPHRVSIWSSVDGISVDIPIPETDQNSNQFSFERTILSDEGNVVVGLGGPYYGQSVIRWTPEEGTRILDYSRGYGPSVLSANGDTAVTRGSGVGNKSGLLLWDDLGNFYDLIDAVYTLPSFYQWEIEEITSISSSGDIVAGHGVNPKGYREPFLIKGLNSVLLPQTLELAGVPEEGFHLGEGPYELSAVSSAELPVKLTLKSGSGKIEDGSFTPFAVGNFTFLAEQVGAGRYAPATKEFVLRVEMAEGIFSPKALFTNSPSFVNAVFVLKSPRGRALTFPQEQYDLSQPFLVTEDGQSLNPTESFLQVQQLDKLPATVRTTLLLDVSSSVGAALSDIRQAASELIDQMLPQQEVAIYSFSGSLTLVQDFTTDSEQAKAAISTIALGGATTDLYGSVYDTLDSWEESYGEAGIETGFLIVLSDGADTSGRVTRDAVIQKRDRDSKTIFTVGLGAAIDTKSLQLLGDGGFFHAYGSGDLSAAFSNVQDAIRESLRGTYWINYASPKRGDALRTVTIALNWNENRGEGSYLTGEFSSAGFSDVERGVLINRSVYRNSGIGDTITLAPDEPLPAEAFTILPLETESPVYEWSIGDPRLLTLTHEGSDSSDALVTPVGWNGTTTLTVTDVGSAAIAEELGLDPATFTKTVTIVIGTGIAPDLSPFALRPLTLTTDGSFHMAVSGKAGRVFKLQGSSNLSDWIVIREVVAQADDAEIVASDAGDSTFRFYRLVPADL